MGGWVTTDAGMGSPVTLISFELSSDSIALIELSVATVNCLKLARVLFTEARDIFREE
jgi:hypothetical protein